MLQISVVRVVLYGIFGRHRTFYITFWLYTYIGYAIKYEAQTEHCDSLFIVLNDNTSTDDACSVEEKK